MKQIMTISAALLFLTIGKVQAQNGIEQVLKNIETNNKELQANEQLITSQKLEAKTDNNLPDPTLSYAHLWGAKDKNDTIGELVVSQSFDFPSLYATRNKLNRLKAGAFDSQSDVFRQEKLLQAKACIICGKLSRFTPTILFTAENLKQFHSFQQPILIFTNTSSDISFSQHFQ